MQQILLSILTGSVAGVLFAFMRLPVPAPPAFAGVAGIIGLWVGYSIVQRFLL